MLQRGVAVTALQRNVVEADESELAVDRKQSPAARSSYSPVNFTQETVSSLAPVH